MSLSPYHEEFLRDLCKKLIPDGEFEYYQSTHDIHVNFDTPQSLTFIQSLFVSLNEKIGQEEIAREILDELSQLSRLLHNQLFDADRSAKHIIAEYTFPRSHVNPARKNSRALVNLLAYNTLQTLPKKQFRYLLTQGEDVNGVGGDGDMTAMYYATLQYDLDVLAFMLFYGGNPFMRIEGGTFFESPYEVAGKFQEREKIELIQSTVTTIQRPLSMASQSKPRLAVDAIDVKFIDDSLITCIRLSNHKTLLSCLKKPALLTASEKSSVHALFERFFETRNPGTDLHDILNNDLNGENNYIELIMDGQQLAGFNLFELISPKSSNRHIFLHCVYSLIMPEYRGYGIMSLLAFRLAFAMQLLSPGLTLGVFFCAVHDNSYRMVKDLLHYPKYQPHSMNILMDDILQEVFKGDASLYHDTITCFTEDDVRLKDCENANTKKDIIEKIFYQYILGINSAPTGKTRAAPVLFYVGDDSFHRLESMLRSTIRVNFSGHIQQLARALHAWMPGCMSSANVSAQLPRSDSLFWQQRREFAALPEEQARARL